MCQDPLTAAVEQDLRAAIVGYCGVGVEAEPFQRGGHEVGHGVFAVALHCDEGLARAGYPPRVHAHIPAASLWLPGTSESGLCHHKNERTYLYNISVVVFKNSFIKKKLHNRHCC